MSYMFYIVTQCYELFIILSNFLFSSSNNFNRLSCILFSISNFLMFKYFLPRINAKVIAGSPTNKLNIPISGGPNSVSLYTQLFLLQNRQHFFKCHCPSPKSPYGCNTTSVSSNVYACTKHDVSIL